MLNIASPTTMRHPRSDVTCCAVAKDQTIVATATSAGVVYLWETSTGAQLLALDGGHQGKVNSLSFSRDAAVLASGGEDGVLNWWFLDQALQQQQQAASTSAADGGATASQAVEVPHRRLQGHDGAAILCCVFSSAMQMMASGGKDCDVILWGNMGRPIHRRLRQHTNWVTCLAFNPESTVLATGGFDHAICMWDVVNLGIIRVLRHHDAPVSSLCISIEGSVLASGDESGTALLSRASDGTCLRVMRGHEDSINGIGFIDNLGLIVTASYDGTVKIWELRGKCIRSFRAHSAGITSMFVSVSDEMFMTTGEDHSARIFPYMWETGE
jgi:eukaryotic-like serine/threonine-protein kinase